jgi:simple sugar transport system ATP-binding protein
VSPNDVPDDEGRMGVADPRGEPPLVSVRGISKTFGATRALEAVGFDVARGRTRALLGRNGAGKSTLVSILTGIATPDSGDIAFEGEPAPAVGSTDAWHGRVACVYQRSTVVPGLTVAENLCLGRQPLRGRRISWSAVRDQADVLLAEWGIPVDPGTQIKDLTVGDRQLVEIARALSTGARFIILDEPTAKLDARDIGRLFEKMHELQEAGVTFLYISHHLQEIFEVCADVTVLRDGRNAGEGVVADVTADDIVAMMTGGTTTALATRPQPAPPGDGPVRLRLDGLSSTRASEPFRGVDLTVRAGEIVGVAGIDGSGKLGVAEVVVGLAKGTGGTVEAGGRSYRSTTLPRAIGHGIGYLPQDRQFAGIVPTMSIAANITLAGLRTPSRLGLRSPRTFTAAARTTVDDLDIKIGDLDDPITSLSGGNQQKVLLGRALQTGPETLVLVAPTAGVDVASKTVLLNAVIDVAGRGTAVLVVSDDVDDLRICDRILVMFDGAPRAVLEAGFDDEALIAAMEGVVLA